MTTTRTAAPEAVITQRLSRARLERFGALTALLQSVATLVLLPVIARQGGRRARVVAAWGLSGGAGRVLRMTF